MIMDPVAVQVKDPAPVPGVAARGAGAGAGRIALLCLELSGVTL